MPRCPPQSSEVMFFIAPRARGGLGLEAVVPNSLLPLHLLAASAPLSPLCWNQVSFVAI